MKSFELRTRRLILREFDLDDDDFILRLLNTDGWINFIGDKEVHTKEAAKGYLSTGPIKSYSEHGFGLWKVSLTNDKTSIGMCGLLKRKGLSAPDLGVAFLPEYHGTGFAREAATAVLELGFSRLAMEQILAITMKENTKAQHLLQSVGMTFDRMVWVGEPSKEKELMLFRIDARPSSQAPH